MYDAGASATYIGNSILILKNSDSGGYETLEAPNMFLNTSILSRVTILIWSCFILKRFVLQVKVMVALFIYFFFSLSKKELLFLLGVALFKL